MPANKNATVEMINGLYAGSSIDPNLLAMVSQTCSNNEMNTVENISRISDTMDYVDDEMVEFLKCYASIQAQGKEFTVQAIDLRLLFFKLSNGTKSLPNISSLNQFILDNLKNCEMFRAREWYTVSVSEQYGTLTWFNKNDLLFLIVLTAKFISM